MASWPERLTDLLAPGSPLQGLARRLTEAGHSCYLVGGTVRDAIRNALADDHDIDVATDARPDAVEEITSGWADHVWFQGRRFGTIGCAKDGRRFEITTFRDEVYRLESRKPEVTYSDDIETDLSRRDFTVNAMAIGLPEAVLVDPHGGLEDLAAARLRTPMSADASFIDDPLRMLRAARFTATLGFEPVDELVEAIERLRGRLSIVSGERIRDELSKLLLAPDPSPGLWLISRTGLSDEFLPELNAMRLEQDPVNKHKDVLAHTIAVVANTRPELRVRLAALLHDIGKPKTRGFGPGGVMFHHHEVVGARMARERLTALRYPNDLVDEVSELVFLHLRFHTYQMGWTDSAVRRYARDAGPLLDDLNHLTRSDCTTRNPKKAADLARRMDDLVVRIEEMRTKEELAAIRPQLDGRQVMELLGIGPGRIVGEALAFLLEVRLEEGVIEEADISERLQAWARSRGIEPGST